MALWIRSSIRQEYWSGLCLTNHIEVVSPPISALIAPGLELVDPAQDLEFEVHNLDIDINEVHTQAEEEDLKLITWSQKFLLWADYTSRIYLPRNRPGSVSG